MWLVVGGELEPHAVASSMCMKVRLPEIHFCRLRHISMFQVRVCAFEETLCSLQGVRVALVIFIDIYILLFLGSINTSIAYNDQFEDIRLAHPACTSSQ